MAPICGPEMRIVRSLRESFLVNLERDQFTQHQFDGPVERGLTLDRQAEVRFSLFLILFSLVVSARHVA